MTPSNGHIFRVTGHLVPGEFPAQRPVTRSFDIFFDLILNKRLSKQSWGFWFEALSCPLWRQCNVCSYGLVQDCSNAFTALLRQAIDLVVSSILVNKLIYIERYFYMTAPQLFGEWKHLKEFSEWPGNVLTTSAFELWWDPLNGQLCRWKGYKPCSAFIIQPTDHAHCPDFSGVLL